MLTDKVNPIGMDICPTLKTKSVNFPKKPEKPRYHLLVIDGHAMVSLSECQNLG